MSCWDEFIQFIKDTWNSLNHPFIGFIGLVLFSISLTCMYGAKENSCNWCAPVALTSFVCGIILGFPSLVRLIVWILNLLYSRLFETKKRN